MLTGVQVGYGDVSPATNGGKVFFIFFILFALSMVGFCIGCIVDLIQDSNMTDRTESDMEKSFFGAIDNAITPAGRSAAAQRLLVA